jgi:GT2 family glycosyltransferase
VTFNNVGHTTDCLKSLAHMGTTTPFEVIVVDNASQDGTRRFLNEEVQGLQTIFNEENRNFAEACNQGADRARGKYLVFLNNDAVAGTELLDSLIDAAECGDNVGAVGVKLVHGDGNLQEAGAILWRDGTALGYGRGDAPAKSEYLFRREVDFASAACLLVKKEVFSLVGGFETFYRPAYYEDTDLCMKIREAGYKIIYDPFSVVTHVEYGAAGRKQAVGWMKQNQGIFIDRWQKQLALQPEPTPLQRISVLRARTRGCNGYVLVFDDRLPASDQGAGYPRMYQLLTSMKELGYHVTLAYDVTTDSDENYLYVLRKHGIEVLETENKRRWLKANGELYDLVILSRPSVFFKNHALARTSAPRARIIYDSEALWYRRNLREAELERYPLVNYPGAPSKSALMGEANDMRRLEHAAIRATDIVIAVCDDEAARISNINPSAHIFQIPTFHDDFRFGPDVRNHAHRKDILLVGGFFNNMRSPNVDAVLYFLMDIFPRIRESLPDVRLNVAGNDPPAILRHLAGNSVSLWGNLSVTDLRALYFQSRVGVVPQRFGSGLKSKVTEAMSLGLPLVVSTVGAEGTMLIDEQTAFITDDPERFAERVIELYTRSDLWLGFARRAYALAEQRYSRKSVEPQIARLMETGVG